MSKPDFLHPFARPGAEVGDFINIVRGEGACVFDDAGNRYVDALASLWYCAIGHGRAEMAEAIARQVEVLEAFHCFEMFTNGPADELCSKLAQLSPLGRTRVFLTDSGSEAVDTAIKLARIAFDLAGEADRHLVVGRRNAYHGVTYGGLSVMGIGPNATGWGPMVGGAGGEHMIDHDDLASAEALFSKFGEAVAAVIAEPVMGAGGVRPPAPGYLEGLRELCDEHGALLIFDEVVCAFGRLGRWWGADRFGVRPDLITFAKGVTSGYQPLGGVLVGERVLDLLEADDSFMLRTGHTYSGHPVTCIAALTNMEIIERESLLARADDIIGPFLAQRLSELLDDGLVSEVRGLAGIWAVEMIDEVSNFDVRRLLLESGVILRPIGATTIALCPPLVISEDELLAITSALESSIKALV
ncbi:MAG: aspartate aminotransferase family protein [Acidobacteria bacterium]|nr:MAG: aspartate aminotransferase family protein [Acidobacteriota bacterium]